MNLVGDRDLLGKSVHEVFPEVAEQGFINLLDHVYLSQEPFVGVELPIELVIEGRRETRFLDFVYHPIVEPDGSVSGIYAQGLDVTRIVIARREVEESNASLESRVAERTAELQAASKEMEGFTYSISHDLRTPLRAIVSTSGMLKDDYSEKLPPDGLLLLERQQRAANRMALLIDDLLHLSRLARHPLNKLDVNVTETAKEIVKELAVNEGAVEIQEGMTVQADIHLFRLLLENLLGNALKFTARGEAPGVSVGMTDEGTIFVKDAGIGFDARYMHKIFLPFERLVTDEEFPGTGIGLANAKRIVERHGGKIWAQSEPGKGATFFFTLG